jgi:Uma2 family endonuclease
MSVLDFVDQIHRYSVDEYRDLVELGAFEDQRVELIDGLILDMSPKSPRHEHAITWLLNEWIARTLDLSRHHVRVSSSLRLATSSPEPDLAIVGHDLGPGQPRSAALVVEVALSSRERDLTIKPRLYAPAVAEYWVLDLSTDQMVVHRNPGPDGYGDITTHARNTELRPGYAALGALRLSELLDAI